MTPDDKANELDVLDSLIGTAGWLYLLERLEKEWGITGARYHDLLEKMANREDKLQAADEIQRVIWVRKEIQGFFRAVTERLTQLKQTRQGHEPTQSRRGVL